MLSYPSSSVSAIREHRDGSVGAPCAKRQQLGSKPWCLKLLPLASFLHLGFPSPSKFIWPSSNRLPEPPIQKTSFCHKEITPLTNSFVVLYTSYRLPQRTQPLVGFLRRLPVESSPPTVPDSQNLSLDSCQTTNNPAQRHHIHQKWPTFRTDMRTGMPAWMPSRTVRFVRSSSFSSVALISPPKDTQLTRAPVFHSSTTAAIPLRL